MVNTHKDWPEHRVKMRAKRGSRPRTKRRPGHEKAPLGLVIGIDRGRYTVALEPPADCQCSDSFCANSTTTTIADSLLQAIKARELPRGSVVVGDRVRLAGDLSGRKDTLARIVKVEQRQGLLRRSLEEYAGERGEKGIVANADYMMIVTASTNPPPRVGMVDRCLVAASEAGVTPILCITKTDLANPVPFVENFRGFDLLVEYIGLDDFSALQRIYSRLENHFSVLVGHSGVGKSTLVNNLVPEANRTVGAVNQITGKGRHTSTNIVALPLQPRGWIVDTPGMRSFGLSHVTNDDVLAAFPGLLEASEFCLPNCTHLANEPDCALDQWAQKTATFAHDTIGVSSRSGIVERARKLLKEPSFTG